MTVKHCKVCDTGYLFENECPICEPMKNEIKKIFKKHNVYCSCCQDILALVEEN